MRWARSTTTRETGAAMGRVPDRTRAQLDPLDSTRGLDWNTRSTGAQRVVPEERYCLAVVLERDGEEPCRSGKDTVVDQDTSARHVAAEERLNALHREARGDDRNDWEDERRLTLRRRNRDRHIELIRSV